MNGCDTLLAALSGVRKVEAAKWEAHCPAHDDNRASLSVCRVTDGMTLIHCHAGCDTDKILGAVGMKLADLYPSRHESNGRGERIVATYDYRDADGTLILQAVRFEPKSFRQRKPNPGGGWTWAVKGCRVVPYRLPELIAADTAQPVYIAEGEKDCDRLAAIGLVATTNVGGAEKWRATHAKFLANRHVVILPDNDDPGRQHAAKVAKSLDGIAASIKVVKLPGLPDKGDVSDWLASGGNADKLRELVEAAPEWTPTSGDDAEQTKSADEGFVKIIADQICERNHFARDGGGKLHRYRDGAYRSKAESYIRAEVKRLCVAMDATKQWSTRFSIEVVEWIAVDAPELWDRPPIDVVNVTNGLLRLTNGELLPHTPEHLSSVQLPVAYDPLAVCPSIDRFVADVFPADATDLAYEVPAWLMTPDTSVQKAVLLLGAGGNGKSTYLAMIVAFLGKVNCTGLSLHKIEANRFAVSRLVGKLANICPDLPTEHLSGTSMFKALTGGDFNLEGEVKFKDGFSFDPFCRLVFSANSPPRSSDASEAFFDRWLVVPFDARFRGTDRELTRKELDGRLSAPGELSGLLNKAVAAWQAIQGRGGRLSEPQSVREAWAEFHAMTDPLSVWLDQYTVDDPQAVVPKQLLRTAYGAACERAGRPSLTERAFGLAMTRTRPGLETANRTVNGRRQWCYVGIGLRDGDAVGVQGVQLVQDNPPLYLSQVREKLEGEEKGRELNTGRAQAEQAEQAEHPEHPEHGDGCPKCGHPEFVDVMIHEGRSRRRDCARCGHTLGFPDWVSSDDTGGGKRTAPRSTGGVGTILGAAWGTDLEQT